MSEPMSASDRIRDRLDGCGVRVDHIEQDLIDVLAENDMLRADIAKMRAHWGDSCYGDSWDATGCNCSECSPQESR